MINKIFVICIFLFSCICSLKAENKNTRWIEGIIPHNAGEKFKVPSAGDNIAPSDYSDPNNWLSMPKKIKKADVFFVYPTSWRAGDKYPVSDINNPEMRYWAEFYLKYRADAFKTSGNIFAPYYRQLDAAFVMSAGKDAMGYFGGVPQTDIVAAFDYYIKNFNGGRPFILVGHSQGSIMLMLLLSGYLKENPEVYKRMIAAYVIGAAVTEDFYRQNRHLKPAQHPDDIGVIISYNTEAPRVEGKNPMSDAKSVLINPVSWKTSEEPAPKEENIASLYVSEDGKVTKRKFKHLADARIDKKRGTIICSTADRDKWSSAKESRAYFPLGVFHENDIPLYYYNLRKNAQTRVKQYFKNK
ncbi:MAG: DUF3089 domain-containing protein [Elusimicrobiota bacterium]|jgi:hypothetical protein|nr:DUF3089 domain-containing protein [Elusimicrobiota bacterium]